MLLVELGTRQHCRDNMTMFSGVKVVGYCIITISVVATPFRHRDLNILLNFFFSLKIFYIFALSLSRSLNIVGCPALAVGMDGGQQDSRRSLSPWPQIRVSREISLLSTRNENIKTEAKKDI